MAITLFSTVVITFAGATATDTPLDGHADHTYRVVERARHHWTLSADGQPVAMSEVEHQQLVALLAQLEPHPDPAIAVDAAGSDGSWITCVVQRADGQTVYRWWVNPPRPWDVLGRVVQFVQQLADKPRVALAAQQQQIMRRFFAALAARDLPNMLAQYHPDIQYRSPLFELRGSEVEVMWQMWWHVLPDVQVVCQESGLWSHGASWSAVYTFSPTRRRITHRFSSDFVFADGKIVRQSDRFNVHEWAGQAYGAVGGLIGGWHLFAWRLRAGARAQFAAFR